MGLQANITAYGHRNASVVIKGFLDTSNPGKLFSFKDTSASQLKLTQVTWLIQEKAGLYLWWDEGRSDLLLPLESRGGMKFDGLRGPEEWDGSIWATAFTRDLGEMWSAVVLVLDFDR